MMYSFFCDILGCVGCRICKGLILKIQFLYLVPSLLIFCWVISFFPPTHMMHPYVQCRIGIGKNVLVIS